MRMSMCTRRTRICVVDRLSIEQQAENREFWNKRRPVCGNARASTTAHEHHGTDMDTKDLCKLLYLPFWGCFFLRDFPSCVSLYLLPQ